MNYWVITLCTCASFLALWSCEKKNTNESGITSSIDANAAASRSKYSGVDRKTIDRLLFDGESLTNESFAFHEAIKGKNLYIKIAKVQSEFDLKRGLYALSSIRSYGDNTAWRSTLKYQNSLYYHTTAVFDWKAVADKDMVVKVKWGMQIANRGRGDVFDEKKSSAFNLLSLPPGFPATTTGGPAPEPPTPIDPPPSDPGGGLDSPPTCTLGSPSCTPPPTPPFAPPSPGACSGVDSEEEAVDCCTGADGGPVFGSEEDCQNSVNRVCGDPSSLPSGQPDFCSDDEDEDEDDDELTEAEQYNQCLSDGGSSEDCNCDIYGDCPDYDDDDELTEAEQYNQCLSDGGSSEDCNCDIYGDCPDYDDDDELTEAEQYNQCLSDGGSSEDCNCDIYGDCPEDEPDDEMCWDGTYAAEGTCPPDPGI